MVKVPFPLQPPLPVRVQVPAIVFPLAAPESASVLPAGDPDCTVKPNLPFTLPLKSPLSVNEPVSVSPETKQGESVVKVKLETLRDPSPLTFSEVPKAKAVELLPLISVAFQLPLMFDALELFDPHPISARPIESTKATANCFMKFPPGKSPKGAQE